MNTTKYRKSLQKNDLLNILRISGIEPEAGLEPATLR